MTKEVALKILAAPKFGDPDCIAAMECLRQEEEAARLRVKLIGKYVQCGACGGTGDNCDCCEADGSIKITKELADSWDIEILQDVEEELKHPER